VIDIEDDGPHAGMQHCDYCEKAIAGGEQDVVAQMEPQAQAGICTTA
jgi:hypothetical protein